MEQDILISVIVPVYNVEAYLSRCMDSILSQSYSNLEIILVEDGTKDSSGLICDEYARLDPRVKVIHKQNGGLSSARNAGIEIARGEYFSFIDSDDWIVPDAYEAMMEAVRKYQVKLVCCGRFDVNEGEEARTVGLCPPKEEVISGMELVRRIFHWDNVDSAAWDKLYHRSLFREIRYPVGKIVEDVPTTYRIALNAGQAAMLNKPIYYYFHRPNSITTASVSERTFHYSQHTKRVYADIQERFPELEPDARYLRIRSLVYNVLTLELAGKEAKEKFNTEYRESQEELRQHVPFILRNAMFTGKEKRDYCLLAFGLYGTVFRMYQKLKG